MSSVLGLGLERFCPRKGCPWPRFFLCPWPWPRALCPRLHLCYFEQKFDAPGTQPYRLASVETVSGYNELTICSFTPTIYAQYRPGFFIVQA